MGVFGVWRRAAEDAFGSMYWQRKGAGAHLVQLVAAVQMRHLYNLVAPDSEIYFQAKVGCALLAGGQLADPGKPVIGI